MANWEKYVNQRRKPSKHVKLSKQKLSIPNPVANEVGIDKWDSVHLSYDRKFGLIRIEQADGDNGGLKLRREANSRAVTTVGFNRQFNIKYPIKYSARREGDFVTFTPIREK